MFFTKIYDFFKSLFTRKNRKHTFFVREKPHRGFDQFHAPNRRKEDRKTKIKRQMAERSRKINRMK